MTSTRTRLQFGFLALTVLGIFVFAGNAERWCPFGGVEALYTYLAEGNMTCSLAVSNLYILGAIVVLTLVARRAFCGYMCPIGTISDWMQRLGERLGVRPAIVPRRVDQGASILKYVVLTVILWFTYRTSELVFRSFDPCYALISRHGEDITYWAYVVSVAIIVASVMLTLPFCRWLCPLAAVLNPFSRVGIARIKRDDASCGQCGQCTLACPMGIAVDEVEEVRSARCMSCMRCVDACAEHAGGAVAWGPPARLGHRWPNAVLVSVLLFCTSAAVAAAYLIPMASFVTSRGTAPSSVETADMNIEGLTCRGKANQLMYFLERDDAFELFGYIKLEAWPGPGFARARITYEPSKCSEGAVKQAITEPYYDAAGARWRNSPFKIQGFDPLADVE